MSRRAPDRAVRNVQPAVVNVPPPPVSKRLNQIAKDSLQYLLCAEGHRGLVKTCDLKREMHIGRDEYETTQAECNRRLKKVLGCKIVTTEDGRMFVANKIPSSETFACENVEDEAKQGFLVTVLSLIFMSKDPMTANNYLTEEHFWDMLGEFDLHKDTFDPFLGDLKRLISTSNTAEFINKGWISVERVTVNDVDEYRFDWGPRAVATVDAMKLLETFCEVMGEGTADSWKGHYAKARRLRRIRAGQTSAEDD